MLVPIRCIKVHKLHARRIPACMEHLPVPDIDADMGNERPAVCGVEKHQIPRLCVFRRYRGGYIEIALRRGAPVGPAYAGV